MMKSFKKRVSTRFLRLNRPKEAMKDAETAKDIDNNTSSVKVIIAQAEAYYHMGQFERALGKSQVLKDNCLISHLISVYYYRAGRIRGDGGIGDLIISIKGSNDI